MVAKRESHPILDAMKPDTPIAVLTGDLVASTALSRDQISVAFSALKDCAELQARWQGAPLHFTRHRGDGWQVVLAQPKYALRSALAFRAALRAKSGTLDTYIGAAEGKRPATLHPDLNYETEAVFVASGTALDWAKSNEDAVRMEFKPHGPLNAAFILADRISRDWTQAQAAAIAPFLAPVHVPTATDVADRLGKSRQAVSKALDAARYPALLQALTSLESGPETEHAGQDA